MKNKILGLICSFSLLLTISCSKEIVNDSESAVQTVTSLNLPIYSEAEPNNTQSTANGFVSIGSTISGTINSSGDYDWFKITSTAGLSFYLNGGNYYLTAYLYDANGNSLGTINYQSYLSINYIGTVYVQLIGYANNNYNLNVTTVSEEEPNNTFSQANGPIKSSDVFSGVADGNVYDYIKITITTQDAVSFYLDGGQYLTAEIYNSSQQKLYSFGGYQALLVKNMPAGTYYVGIYGYFGTKYRFHVNPKFSLVNSHYFKMLNPSNNSIYQQYICSDISFLNIEQGSIASWETNRKYYINLDELKLWNIKHTSYYSCVGIDGYYSNGFPYLKYVIFTNK